MSLRLFQHRAPDATRSVVLADAGVAYVLLDVDQVTVLARRAISAGTTLANEAQACEKGAEINLEQGLAAGRFIAPIDDPGPARIGQRGACLSAACVAGKASGRYVG